MFRGRGNIPHGPGRGNAVGGRGRGGRGRGRGRGHGQRRRLRVKCEICWRCGGAKERLPGCGGEYCRSCGDRANAVIASDLRRRQRRRRELTELLPEVFRAYRAPPDVVGVVLRFVGYDLPGTARPPDRDNRLEPFLQVERIYSDTPYGSDTPPAPVLLPAPPAPPGPAPPHNT